MEQIFYKKRPVLTKKTVYLRILCTIITTDKE